jgi:putative tryptophan/tyrosine transport system substrate-binding protein
MQLKPIRLVVTLALVILTAPLASDAQPPGKSRRVGILTAVTAPTIEPLHALFRQELRERGYVEGQHIVLESRSAEGQYERLPALAAQLVALPVDILVTWGTPAAVAAKQATSTVPIIVLAVGDPVGSGIVASLARPGGNVTGLTNLSAELSAKVLELLTEVVPGLTQIAVLRNPGNPVSAPQLRWTELAARSLGVQLQVVDVRDPSEFEAAFLSMTRERAGALIVLADTMFLGQRRQIADLAVKHRLPAMFTSSSRPTRSSGKPARMAAALSVTTYDAAPGLRENPSCGPPTPGLPARAACPSGPGWRAEWSAWR